MKCWMTGALGVVVGHPMDTVKVRGQIGQLTITFKICMYFLMINPIISILKSNLNSRYGYRCTLNITVYSTVWPKHLPTKG